MQINTRNTDQNLCQVSVIKNGDGKISRHFLPGIKIHREVSRKCLANYIPLNKCPQLSEL